MEQDILRTRTSFVSECFNVEPYGLSDRARRGRLEVLATMSPRNVRERAKSENHRRKEENETRQNKMKKSSCLKL
jgi:hypothetical protein